MNRRLAPLIGLLLAAACTPAKTDGIDPKGQTFGAVAADEVVTMLGTEPFWSLTIQDGKGVWTTPENQPGVEVPLKRFAGNGGLGFTGTLDGKPIAATLTPGTCNDGMSDRRFPFVATIALGGKTFDGCGYTTKQPFTGDKGSETP